MVVCNQYLLTEIGVHSTDEGLNISVLLFHQFNTESTNLALVST
jgi:hypothetical protein